MAYRKGWAVLLVTLGALGLSAMGGPGGQTEPSAVRAAQGRRAPEARAEVVRGSALVGVDGLGRVLVALDEHPADGAADEFLLFTARERLAGPWARRLDRVRGVLGARRLSLVSEDEGFALALEDTKPLPRRSGTVPTVFSRNDGLEIRRVPAYEQPVLLDDLDVADLDSGWPGAFRYDLLEPPTDPHFPSGPCETCTAGGPGATSCTISNGPAVPRSCSVSCSGSLYACCQCYPNQQSGDADCHCCDVLNGVRLERSTSPASRSPSSRTTPIF